MTRNKLFEMPIDVITSIFKFDCRFKIIMPQREKLINNYCFYPPNHNTWFTYGSRNNEFSEVGFYCTQSQRAASIPLDKFATVSNT